jgi:competence protein ComEA
MPRPRPAQIAVYAALGVVLLLLGAKSLGAGGADPSGSGGSGGLTLASEPVGAGGPGAAPASGDVVVHVAGAVPEPGVYRFPAGARVADAVERAGGPTGRAQPDGINLAARLADGQQVVVPERVPGASGTTAVAGAEEGPISLGTATVADLETIDGIGPVTAGDIIAFRDENGGIAAIEELDAVPGIGPATLESLAERLQP